MGRRNKKYQPTGEDVLVALSANKKEVNRLTAEFLSSPPVPGPARRTPPEGA